MLQRKVDVFKETCTSFEDNAINFRVYVHDTNNKKGNK